MSRRCVSFAWSTIAPAILSSAVGMPAIAADYVFDVPSDDRWHYPFNFTPGSRATIGCFGTFGNPTFPDFNDRDGVMVVAWNTSTQIESGFAAALYDVCTVSVRVTNIPGATWAIDTTLDDVSTYRGQPDSDPGRPIELFGAAFGPEYAYPTWDEYELYAGAHCNFEGTICSNDPRDPYPFVFRDGSDQKLHVEDSVKGTQNEGLMPPLCGAARCPFTAIPWAIGIPKDYRPGQQSVPFDVHFEINLALSNGRVRGYFQQQLAGGRVFVIITSLQLAEILGGQVTYPTFYSKEAFGPGVKPAQLIIRLKSDPPGDVDGDGRITLDEFDTATKCLKGPNAAVTPPTPLAEATCRCALDSDADGDIDLRDLARVLAAFPNGG